MAFGLFRIRRIGGSRCLVTLSLSPNDNSHTYHPTSQYDDTVDDHDEKVYRNDDSERTGCDLYHPESV